MSAVVIHVRARALGNDEPSHSLTLTFLERRRSRFRAHADDGSEVNVLLPRGTILRGGNRLRADDGAIVAVCAKHERVSTVRARTTLVLLRAAYHLGNRHVPLQITKDWVRYEHDHVLDDLVRGLGLDVEIHEAPFEPEPGSAAGHAHRKNEHEHGALDERGARCDP